MAFKKDELRILKHMCKTGDVPISGKALLPLIERLESAELCASQFRAMHPDHVIVKRWGKSMGE